VINLDGTDGIKIKHDQEIGNHSNSIQELKANKSEGIVYLLRIIELNIAEMINNAF